MVVKGRKLQLVTPGERRHARPTEIFSVGGCGVVRGVRRDTEFASDGTG
jgi:hypothetical protein